MKHISSDSMRIKQPTHTNTVNGTQHRLQPTNLSWIQRIYTNIFLSKKELKKNNTTLSTQHYTTDSVQKKVLVSNHYAAKKVGLQLVTLCVVAMFAYLSVGSVFARTVIHISTHHVVVNVPIVVRISKIHQPNSVHAVVVTAQNSIHSTQYMKNIGSPDYDFVMQNSLSNNQSLLISRAEMLQHITSDTSSENLLPKYAYQVIAIDFVRPSIDSDLWKNETQSSILYTTLHITLSPYVDTSAVLTACSKIVLIDVKKCLVQFEGVNTVSVINYPRFKKKTESIQQTSLILDTK